MAQYYCNPAADPLGDGTTQALTGPNCAWDELADINAYQGSLNPGDIVSLVKGGEWRETLVITASGGGAGTHVTYNAYGAGDDPIINGSSLETVWAHTTGYIYEKTFANRPMVVVEDDTFLTFRHWAGSVAATFAGATQGCWTEDGVNTAYVWCTDDADPDTHTMEVAAKTGNDRYGIYGLNISYVTIENLKIKYVTLNGIRILVNTGTETDVHLESVEIYNTGGSGIECGVSGATSWNQLTAVTVDGCTVHYSRRHGIIFAPSCSNGEIKNNVTHHCGWGGTGVGTSGGHNISLWSGSSSTNPRNNIIEYNTSYNCFESSDGSEGTGIHADDNTQNCTFRYNISYNNEGSGFYDNGLSGNKWHYLISYNNGQGTQSLFRGGLTISSGNGTEVYNCVFYGNSPVGIGHYGTSVGYTLKNNILCQNSVYEIRYGVNGQIGLVSNYNCVYHPAGGSYMYAGSSKAWAAWQALGYDANSITSDPKLVNPAAGGADNFKLQSDSPCLDIGNDVSLTEDYWGNPVPVGDGVDIGAHEYPASGAGEAIYYVDPNSAGGDGTTPALTGANAAWTELSDITGLVAGDFVLLRRDEVHAGSITVPVDGGSGSILTFGAYGSGAKPIIDTGGGAQTTWVVADDVVADTMIVNGKFTVNTDNWLAGGAGSSIACVLPDPVQDGNCLETTTGTGNSTAQSDNITKGVTPGDKVSINIYVKQGTESTWKLLVWDVTNAAWIDLGTPAEAMAAWVKNALGPFTYPALCESIFIRLQQTRVDTGTTLYFDEIAVYNPAIFKKTIDPVPSVLNEDGTPLSYVPWDTDTPTTFEGRGSGVWSYNGTTVYVRCTDDADPDTHTMTTTGPYGIDGNGKDYIKVENIDVIGASVANILLDGTDCELDGITARDGVAIGVLVTGNTNIIHDSTIKDNGGDGLSISGDSVDYYLNLIYGNGDGGAIISGDSGEGYYNKIYSNTGIGLEISGASNKAYYSLIYGNGSDNVKVLTGASNELYNLISEGAGGHGFNIDESCILRNCIERNSTGDSINIDTGKTVTGGYNCFEDAAKAGAGTYTDTGTSTLFDTDPLFTDIGSKVFTLQLGSPSIDTGLDVGLTEDIIGTSVPQGAGVDMGAYEFTGSQAETGMGVSESTPVISRVSEFGQFDDWEKLIVFEHELGRKLHEEPWTQGESGVTNTWYIDLPDNGEITKVEEDGEVYNEVFSVAACHATPSTFYYDDLNKRLYVHTSGSDSPESLSGTQYNIVAFWWEYISNRPYQFEPYEDLLKEANGTLEFWDSDTVAENWTTTVYDTSTITKEGTNVYGEHSAYSVKLTGDAGGDACLISRDDIVLRPGRRARIRFKHFESASGKTIKVRLKDTGSNVYLNSNGNWETALTWIPISSATDWMEVDIDFIAHKDYSSYEFFVVSNALTSASAYVDDIEIWRFRREIDCHVFLPTNALPVISQAVGDYYQPDEQINYGSIILNNASGYYWTRRAPQGYLWHNNPASLKAGKKGDDYDELVYFFVGITKDPIWGKTVIIDIEDERVLLKKIPIDILDESTYPACETEWRNKKKPILLGRVEDIKPPEIDTNTHKFKISQTYFNREVDRVDYLDDDCSSLAAWTDASTGQGRMYAVEYDDKECFEFYVATDGTPATAYARIHRTLATGLPSDYTIEIKLYRKLSWADRSDPRCYFIEAWNGIFRLYVSIDSDEIEVYDGAGWNSTPLSWAGNVWTTFRLEVDGGAQTVDVYVDGVLVVNAADCSDTDATSDGKVQLTLAGDETAYIRAYTDWIKIYYENVITAGLNAPLQEIQAVYQTTGAGVKSTLTEGVDYTTDLTNGEFTVSAAIAEGDIITCDTLGIKIDFETGDYSVLVADFLYFLYVTLNGRSKYGLDIASLIDLKENRLIECGVWLAEEVDSIDELIKWKKSNVFQTISRLDGLIHFHRYEESVPEDSPHYRVEDYIKAPDFHEDTGQCFKTVVGRSHYLPYSGYYEYENRQESLTAEWNNNETAQIDFDTILANEFQLRDLSENLLSMLEEPIEVIENVILPANALLLNPCDKFYLTYILKDHEGDDIVIYDDEVFRILTIDKDLNTGHATVKAIKDVSNFFWTTR